MSDHTKSPRERRIDRQYAELKAADPDLLRKCVQYAEGVVMNHHAILAGLDESKRTRLAAAIEETLVCLAMEMR